MADKSISQLTTADAVSANDLFEIAHPDAGSATGYTSNKQTLGEITQYIQANATNNNLETTSKTLVGGINELKNAGAIDKQYLTLNEGYTSVATYGGCFYEVSGHVVHLHISVSGLSTSTNNTIATLPSAVRPGANIYGVGYSHTIANAEYSRFFVNTGGSITIRSDADTTRFDAMWLI